MNAKVLGFILLDESRRKYWAGCGRLAPVSDLTFARLPLWESRKEARTAAEAIGKVWGVVLNPVSIRLP